MTDGWSRSCLRAALLIALACACPCSRVGASTPFDGANWSKLLASDPSLHLDPNDPDDSLGKAYTAKDGGGVFEGDNGPKVIVGRAGGEWVAAVPLDSGGSIGLNGWLLYVPNDPEHIAMIGGSESLRFTNGKIVTVTETGGRIFGRGVELTFGVRGKTVTLIRKRAVSLNKENETLR